MTQEMEKDLMEMIADMETEPTEEMMEDMAKWYEEHYERG